MSDPSKPDDDGATRQPESLVDAMFVGAEAAPDIASAGTLLEGLPFAKEIGVRLLSAADGEATLSIAYDERLIGDPDTGVIHGGVVTSLMDTCAGVAVMTSPTRPTSVATLDLRIDYMRPAAPGAAILARARCFRETSLITFVTVTAYHADPEDPIATATGAFHVDGRARPTGRRAAKPEGAE